MLVGKQSQLSSRARQSFKSQCACLLLKLQLLSPRCNPAPLGPHSGGSWLWFEVQRQHAEAFL